MPLSVLTFISDTIFYSMTFQEAAHFLSRTPIDDTQPAIWADLGCGSGLFSQVLSARLRSGSVIYAIDKALQPSILSSTDKVTIRFQTGDFVKDDLHLKNLDGILMANALHYVEDKKALLQQLKTYLLPTGKLIIIEYDNTRANRWIPYPVSFLQVKELFAEAGFHHTEKTGERKSIYQSGKMYVCVVTP